MIKFLAKILCILIPFKALRKKIRNNILLYFNTNKNFLKNKEIIFPPQGLGDILYILLSLENMKDEKKYLFILRKKHFQNLCSLFPNVVEQTIISLDLPSCENFLYQHFHIYKKQEFDNFLDLFKDATRVDIKRDHYFNFDKNYKVKFVKDGFILNKTVLILPESVSCPNEISKEYWIEYANRLKRNGYLPVFNSKNKYGDYKNIFYDLSETINFAECAGYIVGYRSGLCDILSYFTNAKCFYFYPEKPHASNQDYIKDFENDPARRYMEFCSLKKINPTKDIQEFIFNKDNFPIFEKEKTNA